MIAQGLEARSKDLSRPTHVYRALTYYYPRRSNNRMCVQGATRLEVDVSVCLLVCTSLPWKQGALPVDALPAVRDAWEASVPEAQAGRPGGRGR